MIRDRTSKLIKNTLILGFGQFLPKVTVLITLPILTKALTTSEYGIYDLILTAESLLIPLMTLQVQQGIFRKLLQKGSIGTKGIISSAYIFLLFSFIIWCPVLIIIFKYIINYSLPVALIIYIVYLGAALFDVLGQTIRGIGYNYKYSIGIVVYTIMNMLLLVLLYWAQKISVESVLICMAMSYLVAIGYYIMTEKLYKCVKKKYFDKLIIKDLFAYSLPMIPSSIALWVVNLSDRLFITFFLGTSYNGIYSIANKIPNLFASVYAVFNLAWTETAARTMDKDADVDTYYSKMFEIMFQFLSGAMLLLISISPIAFRILIDSQFDDAFQQMPILFLGVFFNCIVSFYGGIYVAKQQTKQVGYSSACGAILNAAINILMIRKWGLYAASISTVISFAIIAVYRGWDLKKYVDIDYNIKKIGWCIISMGLYCIVCSRRNIGFNIIMFIVAIAWNCMINRNIIKVIAVKRKNEAR